jgi:alkanesulfonate monooxygenase SsuD/methylene tetrahydromethanopterin reductase-like flavin-dependent oxidoreductase (luciferase family)
VAYCDGWIPTAIGATDLVPAIADLREQARSVGRNPDSIALIASTRSRIRPKRVLNVTP